MGWVPWGAEIAVLWRKPFCRGESSQSHLSGFANGLAIRRMRGVLFCFLMMVALVEISHCVLWRVLFGHFVCFLAVWVVDAQPGPWGGWLCALLPVLVCTRQPALLVLPAAQEHGHYSQRACHGSYWKMWVLMIHSHRQVSEFNLVRMPFLSNLCTHFLGVHVTSCNMALIFTSLLWDRVSLLSQADLKLTIFLPQPHSARISGMCLYDWHSLTYRNVFSTSLKSNKNKGIAHFSGNL